MLRSTIVGHSERPIQFELWIVSIAISPSLFEIMSVLQAVNKVLIIPSHFELDVTMFRSHVASLRKWKDITQAKGKRSSTNDKSD